MVLKTDPAIASQSLEVVFSTIHRLAAVPFTISVMRAEQLDMRQAPDKQFRAFASHGGMLLFNEHYMHSYCCRLHRRDDETYCWLESMIPTFIRKTLG